MNSAITILKSLEKPGSGINCSECIMPMPQSGGFNTPQLAAESVSKACFGVHTRDSATKINLTGIVNKVHYLVNITMILSGE
jgi:hypothetical protein